GRVLAGADLGRGRLQGSVVLERAASSRTRDAADLVTSLGWSRPIDEGMSFGVESIAQDLEGLWNPTEADGGAKVLVGPSFHAQSHNGSWAATVIAGAAVQRLSTSSPVVHAGTEISHGHHFGFFASASWVPSPRRLIR